MQTAPRTESTNSVVKYKYDKLGRPTLQKTLHDVTESGEVYHSVSYTYDWRGNVLTSTQGGKDKGTVLLSEAQGDSSLVSSMSRGRFC